MLDVVDAGGLDVGTVNEKEDDLGMGKAEDVRVGGGGRLVYPERARLLQNEEGGIAVRSCVET